MKQSKPPNILAVKAAEMFVDRETYIDETLRMRLNTSVFSQGKGLMINSCFELVKPFHMLLGMNVAVLLLQTLERN